MKNLMKTKNKSKNYKINSKKEKVILKIKSIFFIIEMKRQN